MTLSFPSTKTIKDELRSVVGKEVIFVILTSGTLCTTCDLDTVNNVSLDPFCPECSGIGYINFEDEESLTAHVRWSAMDQPEFGPAGQTFEGDVAITIDIDDLTSVQVAKVKKIVVDEREVQPYKTIYRGIPTRDRLRFVCKEMKKS